MYNSTIRKDYFVVAYVFLSELAVGRTSRLWGKTGGPRNCMAVYTPTYNLAM